MQSYAIVMPLVTTPYRLSYSKHGHCNNFFAFFSNYYYLQNFTCTLEKFKIQLLVHVYTVHV